MTIMLEELNGLERKLVLSLATEKLNKLVNSRLKETQKRARVDGFRPGKVPMSMIESMYGVQTYDKVLNEEAIDEFQRQVVENKLHVAGIQKMELIENEAENNKDNLKIAVFFEVYPQITLDGINDKEVEKITCTISEADVEKTIEILRQQRTRYEHIDRPAQKGDRVIIDFAGTINGESFAGGSAENYPFVLGNGQMLPEFEAGIEGMKENEEKDVNVTFPEEYHEKSLAGKNAIFHIKLRNTSEPRLPEINEEFARALGIVDGSLEKMRTEIMKNISREIKRRTSDMTKENTIKVLLENINIDVPQTLVEEEMKRLQNNARQNFIDQGWSEDKLPEIKLEMFKDKAQQHVKTSLIFGKILEENQDLHATDEQINVSIAELADNYEDPQEVIKWYEKDKQSRQGIIASVTEDNIIGFILSKLKVHEKAMGYDEVIKLQNPTMMV